MMAFTVSKLQFGRTGEWHAYSGKQESNHDPEPVEPSEEVPCPNEQYV